MKSTCSIGAASVVLVCLLVSPAAGDFSISGGADGSRLAVITSDVPDHFNFLVEGTDHLGDTDVNFYLSGTDDGSDPWVSWTNEMTFHADVSTGEIAVEMLTHTSTIPGAPARTGPTAIINAWMSDVFHIDPRGGLGPGDPVEFDFVTEWTGHILLEGVPNSGCHVEYSSWLNNVKMLESIDPILYPPKDYPVNRSHTERISAAVGDTFTVLQYIRFDLAASAYADGTGGDNNLDFLDTGSARIRYVPGFEDLNIWSEAGAEILPVPEPTTLSLLAFGGLAVLRRRRK